MRTAAKYSIAFLCLSVVLAVGGSMYVCSTDPRTLVSFSGVIVASQNLLHDLCEARQFV